MILPLHHIRSWKIGSHASRLQLSFQKSFLCKFLVGAVTVLGHVNQCPQPTIVMPLTVEPTKPRLCQDQRYLNNWMEAVSFSLDHAIDLTRYLGEKHQTKIDDKSGYDHILMDEDICRLWVLSGLAGGLSPFFPFNGKSPRTYTRH